jgi:hypothetical protein
MFCFVKMLNDLNFQYLFCDELMLISTFKLNVMFVIDFISWDRLKFNKLKWLEWFRKYIHDKLLEIMSCENICWNVWKIKWVYFYVRFSYFNL